MAASTQRTARTPDGRTLAIEEAGDPGGRPVLVHNGTPNSRHLYAPAAADAAARGLRLIGYDRPGYGGSTPQPGRSVADCAADVRAICAELGIDRLAMWGVSGGGPHLLACAALLPDLVPAAASLASLAPPGPRVSTGSRASPTPAARAWRPAARDGGTTAWPTPARGGSSCPPSKFRCC